MVDNKSTVFVQNNVMYNISSVALVSNTNEVLNVIQPDIQNNTIFLTAEQLQSLGIQVNNDINNSPIQIEKPNLIINRSNNLNNTIKVQKLQSVLINNQNNPIKTNVNDVNIQKVPVIKTFTKGLDSNNSQLKYIQQNNNSKKILYRVAKPDHLKVKTVKNEQIVKPVVEKVQRVVKAIPSDLFVKKSSTNDKVIGKNGNQNDIEETVTLKSVRTRFGRIIKPPKHLKRDKDTPEKKPNSGEPPPKQKRINDPNIQETSNLFPTNGAAIKPITSQPNDATDIIKTTTPVLKKRKIASTKYRCKTCQRFYLGRAKMKKHLKLNPDHKVPKKYESDNQLWLDLLERTYNAPKIEQVNVFIGELTHILEKVKNLVPKGLKPLLSDSDPNSFKIDSTLSTLLGVSEGKYIFDINVLNGSNIQEKNSNTDIGILETINSIPIETLIDEKALDSSDNAVQTSLLNLLDTGQVHFDTDSSNTSEAVRCVDQLVNERLKILTDVELNPTHTSSSLSPPNITLDLSMDMFPYTS